MCQEGSRRSISVLELQFLCVIGVGRDPLAVAILMEMLESCVQVSMGRRAGEVVDGDDGGGGWLHFLNFLNFLNQDC